MTEKPTLPIFREVFGDILRPARQPAPEPELSTTTGEETHAKLKRNLNLALDRHEQIMAATLPPGIPAGDKRLMLEAANMTVKAALTTDRTALKARSDKTIERVWLRLIFIKLQRGYEQPPDRLKMLREAPRAELEAALSPHQLAEYDRMKW